MKFTDRTIFGASSRQSAYDGWGYWCASCGKCLFKINKVPIQRVPKEFGGRFTTENCVILCPDCEQKIKDTNSGQIPWSLIPYFNRKPINWEQQHKDPNHIH
jgi:hypothetical protein